MLMYPTNLEIGDRIGWSFILDIRKNSESVTITAISDKVWQSTLPNNTVLDIEEFGLVPK